MVLSLSQAAALGAAAIASMMVAVWVGSVIRRDASLVDRFWGVGFVLVGWVYWSTAPDRGGAAHLLVALVTAWGGRLSAYLTWRNWGHGEDYRYQAMRSRAPASFPVRSLVTVHLLQGAIMWVVGLPLLVGLRAGGGVGVGAALGTALWAVGFYFEAVGDYQLTRFRADPANRGRVLDTGVWRYTRHPNYFGDACVWWGFFAFAAAVGGWWTVIGPLAMTGLLLRVSGVTLLERKLTETKPAYRDYVARTNAFIPGPPRPSARSSAK